MAFQMALDLIRGIVINGLVKAKKLDITKGNLKLEKGTVLVLIQCLEILY